MSKQITVQVKPDGLEAARSLASVLDVELLQMCPGVDDVELALFYYVQADATKAENIRCAFEQCDGVEAAYFSPEPEPACF